MIVSFHGQWAGFRRMHFLCASSSLQSAWIWNLDSWILDQLYNSRLNMLQHQTSNRLSNIEIIMEGCGGQVQLLIWVISWSHDYKLGEYEIWYHFTARRILPRCQAVMEIEGKNELVLLAVAIFRPLGQVPWKTPYRCCKKLLNLRKGCQQLFVPNGMMPKAAQKSGSEM